MRSYKRRDLTILEDGAYSFVIACDSCGSIGEKPGDTLQISPYDVGTYTARVALMEVLSTGAAVCLIADNICNEMVPTGVQLLAGIQDEAEKIGFLKEEITGSTEENFPTTMTALGVTVMGRIETKALRFTKGVAGDGIFLCGVPKVGEEINIKGDQDLISYEDLKVLTEWSGTKEITLCGSKGILYECEALALLGDTCFRAMDCHIDLQKSCGPATCAVFIVHQKQMDQIPKMTAPLTKIGDLIQRGSYLC